MTDKLNKKLKSNRFLITIDQIGEGKDKLEPFEFELIKQRLIEKYKERISYCCIGRERHKDKGWHCHIWLQLTKRLDYTVNTFNFLCNKKANVQSIKSNLQDRLKSWSYTRKTGDYIEFGKKDIDLDIARIKISNVSSYVIKAIQEGISLEKLLRHEIEQIKEYSLKHSKQIKGMIYELENLEHTERLQALKGIEQIDIESIENQQWQEIAEILNKAENKRPHKTLNLHLWSRLPGLGKTTLVDRIMNYSACYIFPPDGWFTRYTNYIYQYIIWDEVSFVGLKPTFLNLFLEGARCQMPVKGDLTHKWDNPLVIMLSNKPINEHLEKITNERDKEIYTGTLSVRVKEIEITEPLFKFIELIKPKI